jgi:hypothetical protein
MLRRVALVRLDVSKELSASFITVTRIGKLGTTLAVTSNRRTLHPRRHLFFLNHGVLFLYIVVVVDIGCDGMNWIWLRRGSVVSAGALANMAMNFRVPESSQRLLRNSSDSWN